MAASATDSPPARASALVRGLRTRKGRADAITGLQVHAHAGSGILMDGNFAPAATGRPCEHQRERLTMAMRPFGDDVGDDPAVVLPAQHHLTPGCA